MQTGARAVIGDQLYGVFLRLLNLRGGGGRLEPGDAHVSRRFRHVLKLLKNQREEGTSVVIAGLALVFARG